jgi:methylase of polypeptide subunit release factors
MHGVGTNFFERFRRDMSPGAAWYQGGMTEHLSFGTLRIAFDDRVLRPREWTTAQSRWAAELADTAPEGRVLELCAGAGQIGLLAVVGSGRSLVCVDANEVACEFVRMNAAVAGIADRVEVRHGRLQEAVAADELFPIVIADPPWVPGAETGRFPEDPLLAIDGGDDGLEIARACLVVIADHLAPRGSALLQLGTAEQAAALSTEQPLAGGDLVVSEVRQHERGVLVRIDRVS